VSLDCKRINCRRNLADLSEAEMQTHDFDFDLN